MTCKRGGALCLATVLGMGYFPLASGTLASLLGLGLALLFQPSIGVYALVMAGVTITGFMVSGPAEQQAGEKDPSCVVIDEVAGMMIAVFLLPLTPAVCWTAFFLFRAFDMFKVYPACRFEKWGGGKGIMLDDVMAGVYTNIIMQVALRLSGVV